MSFILEALKKSEEERRRGELPDLQSVSAGAPGKSSGHRRWPLLLSAVLLVNAACLLWWLHPWQTGAEINPSPAGKTMGSPATAQPRPAASSPEATVEIPVRPQAAPPPEKPPVLAAPAGWADLPSVAAEKIAAVTPPAGNQPRQKALPLLQELPAAIRGQLPELTISLHYYTTDPAARMIRLNGLILRQGQAFNDRLVLEEITSSGVVFRFGETRFRMRAI